MVICPIARAVHCTGCPFFKFCPAKTTLGDYGKEGSQPENKPAVPDRPRPEKKPDDSSIS